MWDFPSFGDDLGMAGWLFRGSVTVLWDGWAYDRKSWDHPPSSSYFHGWEQPQKCSTSFLETMAKHAAIPHSMTFPPSGCVVRTHGRHIHGLHGMTWGAGANVNPGFINPWIYGDVLQIVIIWYLYIYILISYIVNWCPYNLLQAFWIYSSRVDITAFLHIYGYFMIFLGLSLTDLPATIMCLPKDSCSQVAGCLCHILQVMPSIEGARKLSRTIWQIQILGVI
jgi:hypothetical protein